MEHNIVTLETTTIYTIRGKTFIVESMFDKDKCETLGGVLMRLMKDEIEKKQNHKSQS